MPQRKPAARARRIDVQPGRPSGLQRIVHNPPDTPGATKRPAQPAPRRKRPAPSHPADVEAVEVWLSLHPARRVARAEVTGQSARFNPAAPTCRGVVTAGTGLEQVQRMSPTGQEGRRRPTRPKTSAPSRRGCWGFQG